MSRARVLVKLLYLLASCSPTETTAATPANVPADSQPATPAEVPATPPPEAPTVTAPAETPDPLRFLRSPPAGFVDLRTALPGACFDIRYHTSNNFVGAPLPGYGAPGAWMLEAPADALQRVNVQLQEQGLTLLIYDSYRPFRGTSAMVAWAKRTDQVFLLDNGYIARRSGHNHGHTVDLTIAKVETCEPIDMGTLWDVLDERSHTRNATGIPLENRLLLKRLMSEQGFKPYSKEWWHFQFAMEGSKPRDVPYGCQEPDEGAWTHPNGWEVSSWVPPSEVPNGPCLSSSSAPSP